MATVEAPAELLSDDDILVSPTNRSADKLDEQVIP